MSKAMISAVFVLIALFAGFNAIYIVNEGQQTIVTQFGDPVGEKTDQAGLYLKIPFIQKVHTFDKRILKWDGNPTEIPTGDDTFIKIDTTARWRITNPLLFMQRLGSERGADNRLGDLINGSVRNFVNKTDIKDIVRSSDWKREHMTLNPEKPELDVVVGRDQLIKSVQEQVSGKTLDYGVEILDVLVKRINYTDAVRQKTYDRMISERKLIAQKKRSEGQGERARIEGDMVKELKNITSAAYKESQILRGEADAKVAGIYGKSYNKDPEFYRFLMTMESYKDVLGNNTRLVVDSSSPLFRYLKGTK